MVITMENILSILLLYSVILLITLCFLFILMRFILLPFTHKSSLPPAAELITILNTIMNTEIELYEANIFKSTTTLDNSTFENYYRDITKNIIDGLSKNLLYKLSFYMTEEQIISFICRYVRQYLTGKITRMG